MKLNYIIIKNFKNISDIRIDFDSRITLLEGNTGQGKSAILESLGYVYTGNLQNKISDYIRRGQKKFYIEHSFDYDNKNYVIKITADKRSTSKELVIDGDNNNALFNSDASNEIAKLFNPVLTEYSAISYQNKTTEILSETPSKRLEKLKYILNLSRLNDIADNIKIDYDELTSEVKESKVIIDTLKNKEFTFMDIPDIPNIEETKNLYTTYKLQSENMELKLKEYNEYIRNLEEYEEKIEEKKSLESSIEEIDRSIQDKENYKKDIIRLRTIDVESLRNELEDLQKEKLEISVKAEKYSSYIKSKENLENYINDLQYKISKIKIENIEDCKFNESDIETYDNKKSEILKTINSQDLEYQLMRGGICPTCGQEKKSTMGITVEELNKKRDNSQKQLEEINNKISEIKREIKDYNTKLSNIESIKLNKSNLEKSIEKYMESLNNLEIIEKPNSNLEDIDSKISEIKETISSYESKKKKSDEIKEFNQKIESDISNLLTKKEMNEKALSNFSSLSKPKVVDKIDDIKYNDILSKVKDCEKEINIYEQKLEEKERIEKHNKEIRKQKEENNKKITSISKDIESKEHKITVLKELRSHVSKGFTSFLIDKGSEFIKEKMNEFFFNAYGRYEITYENDNKGISFYYKDFDDEVHSEVNMASGYEQQVLSVAFRNALCHIQKLGLFFVDEIDSNSSGEKSVELYKTIFDQPMFENIICITHSEDAKEYIQQLPDSQVVSIEKGKLK